MREHYLNIVKIIFVIQCYSFIFIWYDMMMSDDDDDDDDDYSLSTNLRWW